jgi:hypothetical protein
VGRNGEEECWTCCSCSTARVSDGGVCGSKGRAPACDVLDADGAKEKDDIPHLNDTNDGNCINAYYESVRFDRLVLA